jgi:predicted amidohydrolase YtcJ
MAAPHKPLLLLLNGSLHTMEADRPRATALAVDRTSGRIVAVGDDQTIRSLAGPLTETIDLGGRTALPGFIDAHTHLLSRARDRAQVDLTGARSEDEAVARVRRFAARAPQDRWILGRHWDKSLWPGVRFPTRASLDAAVPDRPVALWSYDGHALWVNSEALRRAGIGRTTPEPVSGAIARDEAGDPTGMLFEQGATGLVASASEEPGEEADLAALRTVLAELCACGVTGVHNIEHDRSFRLMQRLRATGELSLRVLFYLPRQCLPEACALGLQADFGDDWLRFAGVKVFADGALTSETAALFEPYEGQPENRGLLTTSDAETEALVTAATGGSIGVAIHAIGDRAVHAALDGIERALQGQRTAAERAGSPPGPPLRFRLEHVQLASPEDLARMARLGVIASVQPFHAVADRDKADRYWGARARRAYAYRTMREAGIPLALGSDVPVDTFDPLRILHAAVTRRDDQAPDLPAWGPDQALTVGEALRAYTLGAAYAGGQETRQGSLAPGKLADLVVLGEDPFAVPGDRLAQLEVVATIVNGEVVYGALE